MNIDVLQSDGTSDAPEVHVVVVEDNPAIRDLVVEVLDDANISVEACPLGWQAHLCIRTTCPQVVILDVAMPDVDGIQLFYTLRADPRTRDIPVIFLTARPEIVHSELPNYQEMDAVLLPKPFDTNKLVAMVSSALADQDSP